MSNLCEAKHPTHNTLLVDTVQGKMNVYDYDKYSGFNGYCTGQDDVSRTLRDTGQWEKTETQLVTDLLENGDRNNIVIDFGVHVGWFSLLAAKMGYTVIGYEGEPENVITANKNMKLHNVDKLVTINEEWVGESNTEIPDHDVELVKCDIEGNEQYAVKMIKTLLKNKKIKNIVMEISPTFNDSYPTLVDFIKSCGYSAWDIEDMTKEFNGVYDFPQTNFLFKRVS